jgi:deoxyribonuclease V
MNFKKAEDEQRKLSSKIVLKDDVGEIKTIGGAEAYYVGTRMVACAVVCDASTLEIKEKAFAEGIVDGKFVPEFRAYREGPLLGEALSSLGLKPDVIMFSGEGVMHPRKCGLASHLGVMFDIPSIGISKEAWWGEKKGDDVFLDKEKVASLVRTRDHANPIVVSPGHRVSLQKAVELVKTCIREPHKMPEPVHLAHKYAKRKYKGEER